MSGRFAVEFTHRAAEHVFTAARWWRENRSLAPQAFDEDLSAALDVISTHPEVGAVATNVRLKAVRRIYMHRTGHHLYYRFLSREAIVQVVGLWHSRRGARPRL